MTDLFFLKQLKKDTTSKKKGEVLKQSIEPLIKQGQDKNISLQDENQKNQIRYLIKGTKEIIHNSNQENPKKLKVLKLREKSNIKPEKRNSIKFKHTLVRHYSIIALIMSIIIFPCLSDGNKERMIYSYYSNITIKVKGPGKQSIFFGGDTCSPGKFTLPNEVFINDIIQNDVKDKYDFINPISFVKLVWYNVNNNCNCLFQDCTNIIDIDFSDFDFSLGLHGYQLFQNCKSLISINFNSNSVEKIKIYNAASMFSNCESLASLDISKFDIGAINDTNAMFKGCRSLISLDLSNFVNDDLIYCQNMFSDCPNLIYVNLPSAHYCSNNNEAYVENFIEGSRNIVFCTNCVKIRPIINKHNCSVIDCTKNWRQTQKKISLEDNKCVEDCKLTNYKYTYQSYCHPVCPEGTYNNKINEYICEDCFTNCKICNISGNESYHNCMECKSDYYFELNKNGYKNCYNICPKYYYHDKNNNKSYCTEDYVCPTNYSKLIREKRECIFQCEEDSLYKYEYKNICYIECPEGTVPSGYICIVNCTEEKPFLMISLQKCFKYCSIADLLIKECVLNYPFEENKAHDVMLGNIEHGFTSEEYNISHLEDSEEDIIEFRKTITTLTTLRNQKNNINTLKHNCTFIDLKECETSLREAYPFIVNEDDLFIKKTDVIQEKFRIPKIEYKIYYKSHDENVTKLIELNITTICHDIDLYIPVEVTENFDLLNVSGGYFNNKCYPTISEFGTDLTLENRRIIFVESNDTVCQEGCYFSEYINSNKIVKCSCKPNEPDLFFKDMIINKTKFYEQFTKVQKNNLNINILSCYKELFKFEGISKNICFILIIIFIVFHFILKILLLRLITGI